MQIEMSSMVLFRRLRNSKPILSLVIFCGIWIISTRWISYRQMEGGTVAASRAPSSSNSTLGFGKIYVVSQPGSPRRKALLQAANVTELQLSIPEQPVWTAEDERTFRLAKDSTIGKGSLLAWLGHLNTLKEFLNSGAETALILEDDVDWDIRLRTTQAPLASKAVRSLVSKQSKGFDTQQYPYGDPNSWDLIYFGHCGDYFHGMDVEFVDGHVHPSDLKARPHKLFEDPTMLPFQSLHPFTTSLLKNLGVGQYKRLVHQSVFPLCTFGYAVSLAGARRLLELGSTEPPGAGHKAYDVLILLGCRDNGLRCWTVNPELFHHVPGSSIIDTQQGNTVLPPVDRAAKDQIQQRGETPNINCGFWKGEFSFEEDDAARLGWLQQEVVAKGQCLKDGRASSDHNTKIV